jgi:hypothetical protein
MDKSDGSLIGNIEALLAATRELRATTHDYTLRTRRLEDWRQRKVEGARVEHTRHKCRAAISALAGLGARCAQLEQALDQQLAQIRAGGAPGVVVPGAELRELPREPDVFQRSETTPPPALTLDMSGEDAAAWRLPEKKPPSRKALLRIGAETAWAALRVDDSLTIGPGESAWRQTVATLDDDQRQGAWDCWWNSEDDD